MASWKLFVSRIVLPVAGNRMNLRPLSYEVVKSRPVTSGGTAGLLNPSRPDGSRWRWR